MDNLTTTEFWLKLAAVCLGVALVTALLNPVQVESVGRHAPAENPCVLYRVWVQIGDVGIHTQAEPCEPGGT